MRPSVSGFVLCAVLATFEATAERAPDPGSKDDRIKTIAYSPNDVIAVQGHFGFSTLIEFAAEETVETVSIGDSEAWQVVKPSQPNLLFVKPIDLVGDTNMTVISNKRVYVFMLRADQAHSDRDPSLIFHVRFTYPDDAGGQIAFQTERAMPLKQDRLSVSIAPEAWNFEYTYAGDEALRPSKTFDDGRFTYFAWPEQSSVPAIFLVLPDGSEQLVNHVQRGNYISVERIGRQFTLRNGSLATCIFNEAFETPVFDQAAPAPKTQSDRRFNLLDWLKAGAGPTRPTPPKSDPAS